MTGVVRFLSLKYKLKWDQGPVRSKYVSYACRHTFAHRMLSNYWSNGVGCPIEMLAELMGEGTRVFLAVFGLPGVSRKSIQLGPRSSQMFLDMLAQPSVHTPISDMPAMPLGTFTVGETKYDWHGNGVIRGEGDEERSWHGPYMQRLISDIWRAKPESRASLIAVLDAIESDPTVAETPLDGPGASPGAEKPCTR